MADNPLASRRARPPEAKPHPVLRHAQIWQHVEGQPPETLQKHVEMMDYGLPILGKLAGDPDVTAKDVIKMISGAVADGKMDPSKAVAGIADMPADPDKLRPWLKSKYADALATTVHAKAALMRQGAMQAPGAAAAPAAPAGPGAPMGAPAAPAMPAPPMQGAPPGATIQ